jgi:hypothetical protein
LTLRNSSCPRADAACRDIFTFSISGLSGSRPCHLKRSGFANKLNVRYADTGNPGMPRTGFPLTQPRRTGFAGFYIDAMENYLSNILNGLSGKIFRFGGRACIYNDQISLIECIEYCFFQFVEIVRNNGISDRFPPIPRRDHRALDTDVFAFKRREDSFGNEP